MSTSVGPKITVVGLSRDLLDGVPDGPDATQRHRCDVGVLPYFEDERPLGGLAGFIDWRCSGALSRLCRAGFCSGTKGEQVLLPGRAALPAARWILLGLGPSSGFSVAAGREAARSIVEIVGRIGARDVLLSMPGRPAERAVVEAVCGEVAARLRDPKPPVAAQDADAEGSPGDDAPAASAPDEPPPTEVPWWLVVEDVHAARLRSVLEGPVRPADD